MKFTKLLGLAAAAVFATSANANKLVLDDFTYYDYDETAATLEDALASLTPADNAWVSYNMVIGSTVVPDNLVDVAGVNKAFATTTYTLTPDTGSQFANSSIVNGEMSFSNSSQSTSTLQIDYELTEIFHGDSIDFSAWDAFYIDVVFADAQLGFDLIVTDLWGTTVTLEGDLEETIAAPETVTIGFGNFAGIDFSNIVSVSAILDATGTGAIDVTLSEVGLIPEPAMLAVFGLGLVGLGMSRRRKA